MEAAGRRSVSDADAEATSGAPRCFRPTGRRAALGATPRHRDPIPILAPLSTAERRRRRSPSPHPASRPTIGRRCRNCRPAAGTNERKDFLCGCINPDLSENRPRKRGAAQARKIDGHFCAIVKTTGTILKARTREWQRERESFRAEKRNARYDRRAKRRQRCADGLDRIKARLGDSSP